MRNAFDLMTFTRFLIAEKTSRYFRGGHLFSGLSAAQNRIAALLRTEDAGFFQTYEDYTMVADQRNYDLPLRFKAPVHVERIDGNFASFPKEIKLRRTRPPGARSSDTTYDIIGSEIFFDPAPSSTTPQYRLWYSYSLPDLAYGVMPATSTASAIKLAATAHADNDYYPAIPIDDYYNGVTFEILDGTRAGDTFVADDYAGATRVVTPVTDLAGAPGTATYATHIQIDEDLWEALCLMAAHLSRIRDKDGNYLFGREFISAWQTLVGDTRLRLSTLGEVKLYGVDGVA